MTTARLTRAGLAVILAVLLAAGGVVAFRAANTAHRTHVTAYFANSNGIFVGDDVRILGVRVGEIERIEPQPGRVKVDFFVAGEYQVPANAAAAILSPTLVTARSIALVPAYTSGPAMADHAVIPLERTVVPVEWDDVRSQLQKLTQTLQPTEPGQVSTLGSVINTAADNLRGQGGNIRQAILNLSQALSVLGDHSNDVFGSVKNLSVLVSALHDSADVLGQLNQNLSAVSALLANSPNEVGAAVDDFNRAAADLHGFIAANRETVGTTSDKLTSLSQMTVESMGEIKQLLHVAPNTLANFNNIYDPAQGGMSGVMAVHNFSSPISFICGAIQAASRMNAEQSAKLCVQYLAPIFKNRQYNFPPIGTTIGPAIIPVVGATARPNEITYSEDWMRPDFVPPAPAGEGAPPPAPSASDPYSAQTPTAPQLLDVGGAAEATNPQEGLPGLMVPHRAGS